MINKVKKVLFYSSVSDKSLFFTQKFYETDIDILIRLGYDVTVSNKIWDFLFFWKYDIAFIYFYRYGLFPAVIARFFFKKVYFTGGIDDLDKIYTTPKRYKIQRIFFKLCYLFANHCFLVSSSDMDNVKGIYSGNLPKRLSLSFHTIDVNKYVCDLNNTFKSNDFVTIAWMGAKDNVIRKGIDNAIKLYQELISFNEYKDSKFYIVGATGDGSSFLQSLINQLEINKRIIFTGRLPEEEKIKLLKKSKYYFQLSVYEGFGIAAVEALAAGNIVIHSGKGGLADGIGTYGILLNIEQSISEQAQYCIQKLKDIDNRFLENGICYVKNKFSLKQRENDFQYILKR